MRFPRCILLLAASGHLAQAQYVCPPAPSTLEDQAALQYAFAIQDMLAHYYNVQNFANQSLFMPVDAIFASPSDLSNNFLGLQTQATLGRDAIARQGNTSLPASCTYNLPQGLAQGSMVLVEIAFRLEATLCGAFIGLADYVQSPTFAFLAARLAAEHGIHAAYLLSYMTSTPFAPNSTSLTSAFDPAYVLGNSTLSDMPLFDVGRLGQFLSGTCVQQMPQAPCGGTVSIGNEVATLSGATTAAMAMASSCAATGGTMASGSSTGTALSAGSGTATATGSLTSSSASAASVSSTSVLGSSGSAGAATSSGTTTSASMSSASATNATGSATTTTSVPYPITSGMNSSASTMANASSGSAATPTSVASSAAGSASSSVTGASTAVAGSTAASSVASLPSSGGAAGSYTTGASTVTPTAAAATSTTPLPMYTGAARNLEMPGFVWSVGGGLLAMAAALA